jgi:hypothetical protein
MFHTVMYQQPIHSLGLCYSGRPVAAFPPPLATVLIQNV